MKETKIIAKAENFTATDFGKTIGISSFSAASSFSALALILMKPFLSKVTPMIG